MYDSFETLFVNIWGSLDDVFICVAMAIVLRVVSQWLYWCMASYFHLTIYMSDSINFLFLGTLSVFLLNHLFGPTVAVSLFSGLTIGMGYAFQPYIISLFTGLYNKSSGLTMNGDKILFNGKPATVTSVTLLHVVVRNEVGDVYIPHAFFQSTPLVKLD
jgi:hypothetical protein